MLCYLFSELSRKMVQELSLMTFHWNILKGPRLTFRKNWFARHSKYHSIPRPRKAVPVVHHLHLNSDKWETCFIIGFHGTDNSLTPGVMAISRIISPFDIILRQPWYQPESGYNHLLDIYKQDDHMNELMQQDGRRRGHQNICVWQMWPGNYLIVWRRVNSCLSHEVLLFAFLCIPIVQVHYYKTTQL